METHKEILYRKNPDAEFMYIYNGIAYYYTDIADIDERIYFHIPIKDIGDTYFNRRMEAKLLIKWAVVKNKNLSKSFQDKINSWDDGGCSTGLNEDDD
jgi:hypothetical protein